MYRAYKAGRAEKDPSEFWYKGEIGFFDFYIIPLAKKLKDCGVFGVSSDEYLNYAENNRKEWEAKGHEVVARMVEKCRVEDSDFRPAQTIPDTTKGERDLLSKDSATEEGNSTQPSSLARSKESESTEGATSHDSKNLSSDSPTASGDSHLLAPVAGSPSESVTSASLSRGALEMSEKRFQKQLARVQPSSKPDVKVDQMTFL
jgi:hypothetical protein